MSFPRGTFISGLRENVFTYNVDGDGITESQSSMVDERARRGRATIPQLMGEVLPSSSKRDLLRYEPRTWGRCCTANFG